jgi:hypothetical protein
MGKSEVLFVELGLLLEVLTYHYTRSSSMATRFEMTSAKLIEMRRLVKTTLKNMSRNILLIAIIVF